MIVAEGPAASRGGAGASSQATPADRTALLAKCTLSGGDRMSLLKRPIHGITSVSLAAGVLQACHEVSQLPQERKDGDVTRVGELFLGSAPLALASKKLRADSLGMTYQKLGAITPLLGSAVVLSDRLLRAEVEQKIAKLTVVANLLHYVDCCVYDETPLPAAVRGEQVGNVPQRVASRLQVGEGNQELCTLAPGDALVGTLSTRRGPQKILQTMQSGGMLLRLPDGRFVKLLTTTLSPLVALAAGTGSCIAEAQYRQSGVTRAVAKFPHATRAVCTDSYGANCVAERAIGAARGEAWDSLHVFCDIHRTAGAHDKTFALVGDNVRGMIHCALALQNGVAMDRFRRCMREEIASRFRLMHGEPSLDAQRHRRNVIRIFVSQGSRLALKRVLLQMCPNGDWRHEAIEYFPPAGLPLRPDSEYLNHLTAGLLAALCACQPQTYPRSRWTGADLATDSLGIMEACHKLLSTSFARFVATFEPAARAQKLLAAGAAQAREEDQASGSAMPEQLHMLCDAEGPGAQGHSAELVAASPVAEGADAATSPTWAEVNALHRRVALAWLASRPLDTLLLQRLVMEPLRQLLASQFRVSSQAWEDEQRSRAAAAVTSGAPGVRQYRLSLAAQGEDEARVFAKLNDLWTEPAMWSVMPWQAHTVAFRALAFRMISKAGCVVRQLLDFPHKSFPVRLFTLLADPTEAAKLAAAPECMLDPWSLRMKKMHPGFEGPELRHKLELIALLLPKDTSQIEARHATVRRLLKGASLQTHPQALAELSSNWCCLQYRRRRQRSGVAAQENQLGTLKAANLGMWRCGSIGPRIQIFIDSASFAGGGQRIFSSPARLPSMPPHRHTR